MTLHALRTELGDTQFFGLLRSWTAGHKHSTVTTQAFTDLAAHYTNIPLRPLWDAWLHAKPLPELPPRASRG